MQGIKSIFWVNLSSSSKLGTSKRVVATGGIWRVKAGIDLLQKMVCLGEVIR